MDNEKLCELFQRYSDDVFRLAYSYLGSRADAEDICQNVFLALTQKKIALESGKEKHFLLKCTANASKNRLKTFHRRNVGSLDNENASSHEPFVFDDEQYRELHDAVMSLPANYRAVVHLYYFEGYDQREIADILHITRTTVQTRMSRARILLKKELEENE